VQGKAPNKYIYTFNYERGKKSNPPPKADQCDEKVWRKRFKQALGSIIPNQSIFLFLLGDNDVRIPQELSFAPKHEIDFEELIVCN